MSTYPGIDYSGLGATTNRNIATGIRYGILPSNDALQAWADSSESSYGDPHCPKCGNPAVSRETCATQLENGVSIEVIPDEVRDAYEPYRRHGFNEYACDHCKILLSSDDVYPDEPVATTYDKEGYKIFEDDNYDLWVTESPCYTYAQFCSPCAPGACYLRNPYEPGEDSPFGHPEVFQRNAELAGFAKCYCLDHSWFEDGKAPYPIFSVETGERINP